MKRSREAQRLVDRFHEAALEPELWPDVLVGLADHVGGSSINLLVVEDQQQGPKVDHYERGDMDGYAQYIGELFAIDRRIPRVLNAPVGSILLEDDVLSAEEKKSDIVYNECLAVYGLRNLALINLSFGNTFGGLGVAPLDDGIPFTKDQLNRLDAVLPDLRNATRFYVANLDLQIQRRLFGTLWDYDGKAVVVLDGMRRVLFANALAEQTMAKSLFTVGGGRFRFRHRVAESAFDLVFRRAQIDPSSDPQAFVADDPVTGVSYGVRLIASPPVLSSLNLRRGPAAVLLITPLTQDAAIGEGEVARFCRLFGVTPAETAVVAAVARSEDLAAYARRTGVSLDTVRKQLKSAMAKCGVQSQKALLTRLERFCFLALG